MFSRFKIYGILLIAYCCIVLLLAISFKPLAVYADEVEELQDQINDLNKSLELSKNATKPLESELTKLRIQLTHIQNKLDLLSANIKQKEKDLKVREDKIATQQVLLGTRIRSYYIRSFLTTPFIFLLSSSKDGDIFRELSLREAATREDQRVIARITEDMIKLIEEKEKLELDKKSLAAIQAQVDAQASFLGKEVKTAKDYQASLSSKIAELSARQQAILAARSGQFTASIGDSELADDINASIRGFRESAPAGSFAAFSFGGYTHRKGMSQYGARGRAQAGQDHKAILRAYFGKEPIGKDTGGEINVSGFGAMNFEEKYLYGIAEMPSTWHPEALKAQAIAARTYALRYKTSGQSICTTEACQVFSKSKSDNPPQAWKDAVNSTRGQIIEDVVTFYASTHGVFIPPGTWDTTDGSGGGSFVDKSYEKLGGSPWVYKAWYTQGYSVNSDKCGRSNPWLTGEDLADIINAARFRDERVTPPSSCWGGNPYSREELRAKANGPSSVTSVTVIQGNGFTSEVTFQTDIGEIRLSGSDFKTAFNLRAPGRLSIPQSGFAFFNIEKK